MKTARQLREQKASILAKARALHEGAAMQDRDTLTASESTEFDSLLAQAEALERRAAQTDELEAQEVGTPSPGRKTHAGSDPDRRTDFVPPATHTTGKRNYHTLFGASQSQSDNGGFKTFDEFLATVHSGLSDPRLKMAATVGSGSSGGYLVPEAFADGMLNAALEDSIVLSRADVQGMETDTKRISGFDFEDSSTDIAGFVGEWLRETQAGTVQTPKTRQIKLSAKKLAIFTSASNEVLADGMSFEQQLTAALQSAVSYYLDRAFLTGSGDNQPRGVLNDPAIVEVAAEGSQDPGSVIYENLANMYARLHPRSVRNSIWIVSQTLVPELLRIEIPIGTGGTFIPALREDSGRFYVLGREVLFTEKVPTAGTRGDITLCDLSQYAVGMRRGMTFERSNAPGWTQDISHFRAIVRCDGIGKWSQAYTPANGDSLSWCVTLAART